jgi:ATP-dependent Clp protease ATP-binding subunit ClpB
VDEIILFHSLTREHLSEIVDIQLRHLRELVAGRNITLVFTDRARTALGDEGFDPVYGARPLRRTIQRRIQDPLALELLSGRFRDGDTVVVDHDGSEFVFDRSDISEKVA